MASVLPFRDHALARLRAQLGEAEEAREDLIAFARGHSGAVASIHQAVLAAIATPDIDRLMDCVTNAWPQILTIDSIALSLVIGERAFCASSSGVQAIAPEIVERAIERSGKVAMRAVGRGHPMFGVAAGPIRAEATVAIDCGPALPRGLLLLGQHQAHALDDRHGGALLQFLGSSLGAMIARWLTAPND
ncbi:MAG: DUF484 domain-containing protein [Sphingomicrobium sp.]